jgi:hypothetical protein
VLEPVIGVVGDLTALDFERRVQPVLSSSFPPLVPVPPRPLFIVFTPQQPQSEPQFGLEHPWLRVPGLVFCGGGATFNLEFDLLRSLEQSYVQFRVPKDAPFTASVATRAVRGEGGETISEPVQLSATAGRSFLAAELGVRVNVEGTSIDFPIIVRPLAVIQEVKAPRVERDARAQIGELAATAGPRSTAKGTIFAGWRAEQLELVIAVEDDRLAPLRPGPPAPGAGDRLLVGVARAGVPNHVEYRIDPASDTPSLTSSDAGERTSPQSANVTLEAAKSGPRIWRLTLPSTTFEKDPFRPGDRLLLAVHYVDDDADGFPPTVLSWGGGLDGSRSTAQFNWLALNGGAAP